MSSGSFKYTSSEKVEQFLQVFPDARPQKFVSETGLFFFSLKSRCLFSLQEDVDAMKKKGA